MASVTCYDSGSSIMLLVIDWGLDPGGRSGDPAPVSPLVSNH